MHHGPLCPCPTVHKHVCTHGDVHTQHDHMEVNNFSVAGCQARSTKGNPCLVLEALWKAVFLRGQIDCPAPFSVSVTKHPDKKQLRGERITAVTIAIAVHPSREAKGTVI